MNLSVSKVESLHCSLCGLVLANETLLDSFPLLDHDTFIKTVGNGLLQQTPTALPILTGSGKREAICNSSHGSQADGRFARSVYFIVSSRSGRPESTSGGKPPSSNRNRLEECRAAGFVQIWCRRSRPLAFPAGRANGRTSSDLTICCAANCIASCESFRERATTTAYTAAVCWAVRARYCSHQRTAFTDEVGVMQHA
jgi:hypothetical protein